MKIFKAWRYKCDFCGKNKHQKKAMEIHERGCTMNPDRLCKLHVWATGEEKAPSILDSIQILRDHYGDKDRGLAALREFVGNCPACILAALRQTEMCKGYADEEGYSPPAIGKEQFDFKKELAEVWSEVRSNDEERRLDQAYDFSIGCHIDGSARGY
jgi:hypothetical protein